VANNDHYDPNTATFEQKKAFYEKFSGAKNDQKKNMGSKKAGGTTLPCQQKGFATIYVSDSQGTGLANVSAELSGQPKKDTESPDGAATFDDLDPGPYTANITLGDLSERYCIAESELGPKNVPAGGSQDYKFKLERLASLKVTVVRADQESDKIGNVPVKIDGPEGKPTTKTENTKNTGADKGTVLFEKIPAGNYDVAAELTGQLAVDYHRPGSEKVEVKPTDNPKEHRIRLKQPRVYLQLSYQDPEKNVLPFPKDFPVKMVFDNSTTKDLKVLDDKGNFDFKVEADTTTFTLDFESNEVRYLVHKKGSSEGVWVHDDTPILKDPDDKKLLELALAGKRFFSLPKNWNLINSVWEIKDADTYNPETSQFEDVDKPDVKIGQKGSPVTVALKPHWQFMRFVYFDRIIGGTEQISILPVTVEGYDKAEDSSPATRSNWTVDADRELVQCLPWIIQKPKTKPDKKIELRFRTEANSFIETAADESRDIITGADKNKPNADRLRFYDLPSEWRSTNYYIREEAKGTCAADKGKFIGELEDSDFRSTTKAKPFIFSLDDIVLYRGDPKKGELTKPLELLKEVEKVLVFSNTFAEDASSKVNKEGVYRQAPEIKEESGQKHTDVFFPSSEDVVVERAGKKVKENYIKEYPDWTRLVIAKGSMFDAFDKRTVADDGNTDRVVGARAAVCWFDSENENIEPPGKKIVPRPKLISTPFFSIQPYFELEVEYDLEKFLQWPQKDKRRDNSSHSDRKGQTVYKEWEDPYPLGEGFRFGRYDMVHIRCCGMDTSSSDIERTVNLQYFKMNVFFVTTGKKATKNITDTEQKKYITDLIENLSKRWNGYDSGFTFGRPTVEPRAKDSDEKNFKTEIVKYFQSMPEPIAHIKAEIVAIPRPFMNSYSGISNLSDEANTPGWTGAPNILVAAHEFGHCNGILDDYPEQSVYGSYGVPGFRGLTPGDPYSVNLGNYKKMNMKSMMWCALDIHHHHLWHAADWLFRLYGFPFQLTHNSEIYKIDHNPANAPSNSSQHNGIRTYVQMPRIVAIDAGFSTSSATAYSRFDSYLYELGSEEYSKTFLPSLAKGSNTFTGILCITINIKLEFEDTDDHDTIGSFAQTISEITSDWNYKWSCEISAGTDCEGNQKKFDRCLIHLFPKQLILPFSENAKYAASVGADSKKEYADKVADIESAFPPHLVFKIAESLSHDNRERGIDSTSIPAVCYETYRKETETFLRNFAYIAIAANTANVQVNSSVNEGIVKVIEYGYKIASEIRKKVDAINDPSAQLNAVIDIYNEFNDIVDAADGEAKRVVSGIDPPVTDQSVIDKAEEKVKLASGPGQYIIEVLKICTTDASKPAIMRTNWVKLLRTLLEMVDELSDLFEDKHKKIIKEHNEAEQATKDTKRAIITATETKEVIKAIKNAPNCIKLAAYVKDKPESTKPNDIHTAVVDAFKKMTPQKYSDRLKKFLSLFENATLDILNFTDNYVKDHSAEDPVHIGSAIAEELGYNLTARSFKSADDIFVEQMKKYLSEWLGLTSSGPTKDEFKKFAESVHDGNSTLVVKGADT